MCEAVSTKVDDSKRELYWMRTSTSAAHLKPKGHRCCCLIDDYRLDVGLVDYQGQTASGVLLRGDNPVLMTFELVLADLG
jgi:hypothetical protein